MSQPNPKAELAEWMNTNIKIEITMHGQSIYRNYALEDRNVPESAKQGLEEMVANLLDLSEI